MIADISSNVIIEVEHLAMKINPKKTSRPTQFLLYADLQMTNTGVYGWRFVLESLSGSLSVEASDVEPGTDGERLELLAVVRALESLDQPSEVVLLTPSRYVVRGLRHGLDACANPLGVGNGLVVWSPSRTLICGNASTEPYRTTRCDVVGLRCESSVKRR